MAYQQKEWHPALEEYCEVIYELREDSLDAIQSRIAERLEISRPAVSEMIRRLEKEGLVKTEEDSQISLTAAGQELAESVVRRHRLAERFLTDILKLSWSDAHHEAGKWEHVISPTVEDALNELLGEPTTCPHGNPIPGSDYVPPKSCNLSDLEVEERFTVLRIPEELEFTPGLLKFLEKSQIVPGNSGSISALSPDGTRTIKMGDEFVGVSQFAADRILVASK